MGASNAIDDLAETVKKFRTQDAILEFALKGLRDRVPADDWMYRDAGGAEFRGIGRDLMQLGKVAVHRDKGDVEHGRRQTGPLSGGKQHIKLPTQGIDRSEAVDFTVLIRIQRVQRQRQAVEAAVGYPFDHLVRQRAQGRYNLDGGSGRRRKADRFDDAWMVCGFARVV